MSSFSAFQLSVEMHFLALDVHQREFHEYKYSCFKIKISFETMNARGTRERERDRERRGAKARLRGFSSAVADAQEWMGGILKAQHHSKIYGALGAKVNHLLIFLQGCGQPTSASITHSVQTAGQNHRCPTQPLPALPAGPQPHTLRASCTPMAERRRLMLR